MEPSAFARRAIAATVETGTRPRLADVEGRDPGGLKGAGANRAEKAAAAAAAPFGGLKPLPTNEEHV